MGHIRALHPPPHPANSATSLCPRRLVWPRTLAFHAGNVGSNPAGDASWSSLALTSALRHGRRAGRLRLSLPQRAGPRADPIQQEIEQRPVKPAERRAEYRNCPQPHPPRERHGCHATKRSCRVNAGSVTKSSHSCERQDAKRRPAPAGSLVARATLLVDPVPPAPRSPARERCLAVTSCRRPCLDDPARPPRRRRKLSRVRCATSWSRSSRPP